jgi:Fe-S-cluster containining protein
LSSSRKKEKRRRRALARKDARGRVHLVLQRDAAGNELVALTRPVFQEAWQNELTAGTANTARALLRDEPTLESTRQLARQAMAATSRLADGLLARAPAGSVACRAGCDHCCYQVVGVTPAEALAVVDHVRRTRSTEEVVALAARAAELVAKAGDLDSNARFSPDHPCLFLDVPTGQCTIYEARPLACRGMNSLDAEECAKRLREPEVRAAFLAQGFGGHSYMEPIRAFHAISAGLQLTLAELYELDPRPLELLKAVHLLLGGDETALANAWLEGESPFEAARAGDKSNDAGMRVASGALGLANDGARES